MWDIFGYLGNFVIVKSALDTVKEDVKLVLFSLLNFQSEVWCHAACM